VSIFRLGEVDLPPIKIDLAPAQSVLLTHPHPGVKRQPEMVQEFGKALLDHLAELVFLVIGKKPDPAVPLRLAPDSSSRIAFDLLVIDSNSEYQRKGRLPAIAAACRPTARGSAATSTKDRCTSDFSVHRKHLSRMRLDNDPKL
jgi:hypothetical protein